MRGRAPWTEAPRPVGIRFGWRARRAPVSGEVRRCSRRPESAGSRPFSESVKSCAVRPRIGAPRLPFTRTSICWSSTSLRKVASGCCDGSMAGQSATVSPASSFQSTRVCMGVALQYAPGHMEVTLGAFRPGIPSRITGSRSRESPSTRALAHAVLIRCSQRMGANWPTLA